MLKTALAFATLLILSPLAVEHPAAAEEVDLELVLAADGSGSIDDDELALQRRGYADAIMSREVLDAIQAGLTGRIAVAYVEWGGPTSQHVIVDWSVVSDEASAKVFADKLVTRPRAAYGYNSISAAIDFSVYLIENNAYEGLKAVIDVSGDGPNIGGRPVQVSRDEAVAKGVTINGLVIQRPGGMVRRVNGEPLSAHYERDVIGGPGAFVVVADETTSFPEAVRRKMVLEIAANDTAPAATRVD
ncbi:DUF1194 domain-containing protein [Chthonobacter rhizosphaerae]|uniref:DUF1194 domain-containing protein n=1 Tax=Chthonobacter rhizosphaerae TaxID=2735553 RepID=UPI0015EFD7FD|nr:DUF1194 domain-containing protein [Chthonobacter rhizosphaerae]